MVMSSQAPYHTLEDVLQELGKHSSFLITTHVNPDGDAIGSALGLMHVLEEIGGSGTVVNVVLPSPCPLNLRWLPGAERIVEYAGNPITAECVVVLDLNAISRMGALGSAIATSPARIVNVDHHTFPEDFAHVQWIDVEASSTCQLIAMVSEPLFAATSMSRAAAQCLYVGLMTDSGSFRFPRTTPDVFRVAARLVEAGADPVEAYERVYNQNSLKRTQLLGHALSNLAVHHDGRVCTMMVTQQDLEYYGCSLEDTEGLVHYTLSIEGVMLGILFIELTGEVKCSFRSKGTTFVRDLAALYGGGGHLHAAGARIPGTMIQVVTDVVARALAAVTFE